MFLFALFLSWWVNLSKAFDYPLAYKFFWFSYTPFPDCCYFMLLDLMFLALEEWP